MSILKRQFCKKTILFNDLLDKIFDDENELVHFQCTECKNTLRVEYSTIRWLAGQLLARSRKKRK